MWIATMSSETFMWMAAGETREEALRALELGFRRSSRRLKAPPWQHDSPPLEWYGAWVQEILPGQCLRDETVV